ncbi:MAG: potassium transporter Trk [Ruminococcaceae bacterium]|nr:potassium transporter Trk [Oscillospiraceae bacterium]
MPILNKNVKKISPARTLVLGFLIIILVGTLLLFLPFASADGTSADFSECLFTATSATCVTGITVADTYSSWSLFGQIVIALLIQIGGLGFVSIITFFNIAAGKKLGFRTLANAADGLTENSFVGGRSIFVSIIKYSLIIELVGAVILGFAFVPKYGAYGVWVSIFMSISAFCNAGFDLMGQADGVSSLIGFSNQPLVLITIALLITIGGLGFVVWENFLNIRKVRKLSLHTRAVLLMTAILVVGGTIFYLASEWSNPATIGDMDFGQKLLNAFFSSVSNRSAGFSSIDVAEMTSFSQLGTMLLMMIGVAPASTGGGIKVTTLLVLVMTVVSYIKNKNDVEIFRHKIDKLTVYRTLVITTLTMSAVMVCFTVIYCFTSFDALQCLFESVAACSTAGLSLGVSSAAGFGGKAVIMLFMFCGRIGPVSLIMSLTLNSSKRKNLVVPDGQIFIG